MFCCMFMLQESSLIDGNVIPVVLNDRVTKSIQRRCRKNISSSTCLSHAVTSSQTYVRWWKGSFCRRVTTSPFHQHTTLTPKPASSFGFFLRKKTKESKLCWSVEVCGPCLFLVYMTFLGVFMQCLRIVFMASFRFVSQTNLGRLFSLFLRSLL